MPPPPPPFHQTTLDLQCKTQQNGRGGTFGTSDLHSSPTVLGLGMSAPPCFRVLFWRAQQCSILRNQTTGDLKSHYLQARVTALSVPPPQPPFHQTTLDLQCKTQQNGRGGIFGTSELHSSPTALGLGMSAPSLFPCFVLEGAAVFYPPRPDYRRFKIPSFTSPGHSSVCAPATSPPFLSAAITNQVMT